MVFNVSTVSKHSEKILLNVYNEEYFEYILFDSSVTSSVMR